MKKLYLILFALFICSAVDLQAKKSKNFSIPFSTNDFHLTLNTQGDIVIISNKQVIYEHDTKKPGLPFIPINLCVPYDMTLDSITYTISKTILRDNVNIAPNPSIIRSDGTSSKEECTSSYPPRIYPTESILYKGETVVGKNKLLSFWLCPFQFDNTTGSLAFVENVELKIGLLESSPSCQPVLMSNDSHGLLREITYNMGDISIDRISSTTTSEGEWPIEYVIITTDNLVNAFKPLADWKKQKGVNSKIVTLSEISQSYSIGTIQQKIKQCLRDYYNQGLKYALLGGDGDVVPVQECAAYLHLNPDNPLAEELYDLNDMQTDLYYGCFGGDFYWNANGNDSIGEPSDNANLFPNIYVTRAPIRTSTDAQVFGDKIINYEKALGYSNWNNRILMAGNLLGWYVSENPEKSDSEAQGDNLFYNYIQPYWSGSRTKFYDTYTDFSGNGTYALNGSNLQSELANGYAFVDMMTHGDVLNWFLESHSYYNSVLASALVNNQQPTIITTVACTTNKFHDPNFDPCLSEAFIRNPNSGIIAYLGCSEPGIVNTGTSALGPSTLYEAQYYSTLFSQDNDKKSFGKIVAQAKAQMISSSLQSGPERWIQFGLNPVGDPEMPIFTTTPLEFGNIDVSFHGNNITVNTGVNNCTICVMSLNDLGTSYYEVSSGVNSATFNNVCEDVSICITKQGYVPKLLECKDQLYVQNMNLATSQNMYAREIEIGTNVTSDEPSGPVNFTQGTYVIKGNKVTLRPTTRISLGTKVSVSN